MNYLVTELMKLVGADLTALYSFSELFTWFVTVVFSIELVLFVLDGIFYCARSVARGIK